MTTIICNAEGNERKRMAKVMGEFLSTKPVYLRAPSYAYQLGDYTITRDSKLVCPDSADLEIVTSIFNLLKDSGFEPMVLGDDVQTEEVATTEIETTSDDLAEEATETAPEAENPAPNIAPEIAQESPENPAIEAVAEEAEKAAEKPADAPDVAAETPEAPQPTEEAPTRAEEAESVTGQPQEAPAKDLDPNRLTISIPKDKLPNGALSRLQILVANKEALFKRALLTDSLPIKVTDDTVSFPWFKLTEIDGEAEAYAQFITHLVKMANEQTRVLDKPYDGDNDRFAMRIFMVRLGMKGQEFALARKLMMKNLTGNSGWRYGGSATKLESRNNPNRAAIQHLKKAYPTGSRLTFISMNDASDGNIHIGDKGAVIDVDDNGNVFIKLDNGLTFGISFSRDNSDNEDDADATASEEASDTADDISADESNDAAEEANPDGDEEEETGEE